MAIPRITFKYSTILFLAYFIIGTFKTRAQTSSQFLKEIPIEREGRHKGQPDLMFQFLRKDASDLNFDSLEKGFDSLQVRIWLGHSLAVKRNLVILKVSNVAPISGWNNLVKNLLDLKILTLQNANDIEGYNGCGMDGIVYYFETSTKKRYRFYYYCNPDDNLNKYWQAKSVLQFSYLLEKEFDFTYTK
jgi:hypothetical protein